MLTVLYDACVLYPAPLRDLLMHLALTELFQARWSARIHEEWIDNVLAARPDLSREQLNRTRALMDANIQDGLVENYESLIDIVMLPDPNDRHVLAAAIACRANLILTFNLRDFPAASLQPYVIQSRHPDLFVTGLIDGAPDIVCTAVRRHRTSLKHPPKTVAEYLDIIERQGLPQTVVRLREYVALI